MKRSTRSYFALGALLASAGCATVIGLDDFEDGPTTTTGQGGSGATGTGAGTTTTTTTDSGGGGTSQGGNGGTGGDGKICEPGAKQKCPYTGASGTENVGICHAGERTCNVDGTGYTPCENEVKQQAKDDCATPEDENCDGNINDACPCIPQSMESCYSGPGGTAGVGICLAGTHTCNGDGMGYGPCVGEVLPATETCNTPDDDDCDGQKNEDGPGCVCVPDSTATCYTGPPNTQGVGICLPGTKQCNSLGTAYGACVGEVLPAAETCNTPVDDDCNGQTNEGGAGCVCLPNSTASCYSGPPNTQGVGICMAGTKLCNAQGTAYGACAGEVLPSNEVCTQTGDENCDGIACSEPVWSKSFQTGYSDYMVTDAQGNTLLLGHFSGSLVFGATTLVSSGASDLYLAKLDPNGQVLWAKKFGDAANQISPNGVGVDPSGNITIAATLIGTTDFGGGGLSAGAGMFGFAVAHFDANGAHLWSKAFQSSANLYCKGLDVDTAGGVVLAGELSGTVNFGNGALTSAGATDIFVAKLAGVTGNATWSKKFGDANSQGVTAVDTDGSNNIVLVGVHSGVWGLGGPVMTAIASDVYIGRLDNAGNWACSKTIDVAGTPTQVRVDPLGAILITGTFTSAIDLGGGSLANNGMSDIYLAKFSSSCFFSWSKSFGGAGNDWDPSIAADSTSNILLGAQTSGITDFGGGPLAATGAYDITIAKFTSAGTHTWSKIFTGPGAESHTVPNVGPANEVLIAFSNASTLDLGLGPINAGVAAAKFQP